MWNVTELHLVSYQAKARRLEPHFTRALAFSEILKLSKTIMYGFKEVRMETVEN